SPLRVFQRRSLKTGAPKSAAESDGLHLVGEGIGFSISADMTQELRICCLGVPPEGWTELEQRTCERVDLAEVEFTPGDWPKTAQPLRYVAVRFTPLQA